MSGWSRKSGSRWRPRSSKRSKPATGLSTSGTPKQKYGAKRVEVDGIKFHSKKEAERYRHLRLLERAGEISGLQLQPRFELRVLDERICFYVADFRYLDAASRSQVVEDVKGYRTPEYKLKAKLFRALYPEFVFVEI